MNTQRKHRISLILFQNEIQKRDIQIFKISIFLLCSLLCSYNINAQPPAKDTRSSKGSLFSINMEVGFAFPRIKGESSLDISSLPTSPEPVVNFTETKIVDQKISTSSVVGLEGLYRIKPRLSIGLATQFGRSCTYNSSVFFTQDKQVVSNNLMVSSFGEFRQKSNIRNTTINAVAYFNAFGLKLSESRSTFLEIGFGGGASFYKISSSVPHILLRMDVRNNIVNASYILGPGSIVPEIKRSASYSWQLSSSLLLKSTYSPDIKIGFRVSNLGNFIIMKQPAGMNTLFELRGTNSGSQDQELILSSLNSRRTIISKEIFIRFFLW